MSELSPRASELVRSARAQSRPTLADRERIQSALQAQLGTAVLPGNNAPPPALARWPYISSAIVGAGLIGGALFLASRHEPVSVSPTQARATPVIASAAAPLATTAQEAPAPSAATPVAVDAPEPPVPDARPARDLLAQEVALLARATSDLHAGRAADALKVLDEYQRRFPKGLLTEERRAARAQALCSLGRTGEAQAEIARLAPQSLAAARAKQVCDARSTAR